MNKEKDMVLGECLRKSLKDIEKHPNRKLMMGPPAFPYDTAHFWTEDKNHIYEHVKNNPTNYKYIGKQVNPVSIKKEVGIK